jgi:hypothetical protein
MLVQNFQRFQFSSIFCLPTNLLEKLLFPFWSSLPLLLIFFPRFHIVFDLAERCGQVNVEFTVIGWKTLVAAVIQHKITFSAIEFYFVRFCAARRNLLHDLLHGQEKLLRYIFLCILQPNRRSGR